MIKELLTYVDETTFISYNTLLNMIHTLIVFFLLWIVKRINIILMNKASQVVDDPKKRYQTKKMFDYLYRIILIIALMIVWEESLPNIFTFLGLFTAGLAVALKEPLVNMVGGIVILLTTPFKVGDRIELGAHRGDIIDTSLLNISLLEVDSTIHGGQSTGRIVKIPCSHIFIQPLANYEEGFKYIWNELSVKLTIDSNWKKAKDTLMEVVDKYTNEIMEEAQSQIEEASKHYLIYYNSLTPTIYTNVQDGKIILTLRYLCRPRHTRTTEHQIWEEILSIFSENPDITMC